MRKHFEEELDNLSKDMIRLGALCEEAILLIITDLCEGNKDAYAHMSQYLDDIKQKERAIEGMCIRLLMQQQPVAGDLRRISAALKMVTDMERIGVQCADIAEIITYLNGKACGQCEIIRREAEEAGKMVTGAVNAFVRHDSMLAEEIVKGDDVVDVLFSRVRDALLEMIISKDSDGSDILDLLMISKYFERIADHAVNIAEWVIFAETGVRKSDE